MDDDAPATGEMPATRMSRRALGFAGAGAVLLATTDLAAAEPGTELSVKPIRRSSAVVTSALSTSARITVTTSAPSIATVTVTPAPAGPKPAPSGPATQHAITVTGLNPQTVYDFAVRTRPARAKSAPAEQGSGTLSGAIVSAPEGGAGMTVAVVDPPQVTTAGSRAGIRWQTNIVTNGRLEVWPYGADGDERALATEQRFETPTREGRYTIETSTVEHRICIDGRKRGRKYGFNIGCAAGENEVNWGERWFRQARRAPAGMLPYGLVSRGALPAGTAGILALPGDRLLAWSESGAVSVHDAANGFGQLAGWQEPMPVRGAALGPDGRLYLALEDRRQDVWNCRCSHGLAAVYVPVDDLTSGYAAGPVIGLPGLPGEMPGQPAAIALDSAGNLHVAVFASRKGQPVSTVYLFLADVAADTGFTYQDAYAIADVTGMAPGPNGTMYFLGGSRSVIAATGGLLAQDSPVTQWDGASLGGGAWILAAGLCGGPSGSIFVIDGCLGGVQEVRTNDLGAFRMFASWQTRGARKPNVEQPAGITAGPDGMVCVLDAHARNGRPAVIMYAPNPASVQAAPGRWVRQPYPGGIARQRDPGA
ncbi:MAG: hypothetical protein ACKOWF_02525 [Chloroflexota bacterium]